MTRFRRLIRSARIAGFWFAAPVILLSIDAAEHVWVALPVMALMAFLYRWVFITAPDSIQGSVIQGKGTLNSVIDAFCLFVFSLSPYRKVRKKRYLHHNYTGAPGTVS